MFYLIQLINLRQMTSKDLRDKFEKEFGTQYIMAGDEYMEWLHNNECQFTEVKFLYMDETITCKIYFKEQLKVFDGFVKKSSVEEERIFYQSEVELLPSDYHRLLSYLICSYNPYSLSMICK